MDLTRLSAPFPRASVHWRVQGTPYERNGKYSAMALAYIDARDVMDRLDEVCSPAGWQDEYIETPTKRVICRIGILTDNGWVWKGDGAGATDVEGEKGGISDALKRAAVQWGIGRYLYRLDSPWVACEVTKKGDKVYWKKWAEDPWSKVREVGYQPTLPPEDPDAPAPKAEPPLSQQAAAKGPAPRSPTRDPRKVADALIAKVKAAGSKADLDTILGLAKFDEAWEWTAAEAPAMGEEIRAAVEAARAKLDPMIYGDQRLDVPRAFA